MNYEAMMGILGWCCIIACVSMTAFSVVGVTYITIELIKELRK